MVRRALVEMRSEQKVEAARAELSLAADALAAEFAAGDLEPAEVHALVLGAATLARSSDRSRELEGWAELSRAGAEALADPELTCWVELQVANGLYVQGAVEGCEEVLRAAIESSPRSARSSLSCLHFLAELTRKQSRFDEALDTLDHLDERLREGAGAKAVVGESAWHGLRAAASGSRGQVLRRLGLPDRASVAFRVEASEADRSGSATAAARSALNLVDLDLMLERFESARERVQAACEASWYGEVALDVRAQFEIAAGLASSELEREGRPGPEAARATLEAVLAKGHAGEIDTWLAEINLVDLCVREADWEAAQSYLERASERRAAVELAGDRRLFESALLAAQAARLALARGDEARLLAEHRVEMRAAFDELLEAWGRTPHRPGGLGFLRLGNRRQVLSTLIRLELALEPETGSELALGHWLRAEALGSTARLLELPTADLARLRDGFLGERHGALVLLPAKDRSHLFALDGASVEHFELPSRDRLRGAAEALTAALAQSPARMTDTAKLEQHVERLTSLAARLTEEFLAPGVRAAVEDWEEITTVGFQLLGSMPFACLEWDDQRRVGERFALSRAPSLSVGAALMARTRVLPTGAPVLIANLDPRTADRTTSWRPLEVTPEVVTALTRSLPNSRVHSGREVTPRAVLEQDLRDAPVVQFLAHGVYRGDRERGAALLLSAPAGSELAEDSYLTCEQIEAGRRFGGGLVVLAACGSGRGPARAGDDTLAHLGGAFLKAGAGSIVLAERQVELGVAVEVLGSFFEHLAGGASPAESLRRARAGGERAWLESYYLAPFEVIGAGFQPVF